MQAQFDNNLNASFYLFVDNRICNVAQAYITTGLNLYYINDPALPPQYLSYSSPFKQWIYDSGVSGAHVINSVADQNGTIYNRASGVIIDYDNGRAVVPSSFGTGLSLTGLVSIKEINVWQPNETEEYLLTQAKFYFNPRYMGAATGAVPPYAMTTPAVFINTLHSDDNQFALGGLDDTTTTMSILVIAESNFQLNAMISLFRDARYKYFPLLTINQDPISDPFTTVFGGDLVSGIGYNYTTYTQQFGTPGNLVYIKDVKTSKVSDRVKMNSEYFVGLIDVACSYVRMTV